ncbi:2,3-diaminopropionate biosynthesis protein SbnB [Maribacter sp. 2307UL18-2]|uniref:2,3-diaminopropionate biosynthesis protein SbnB n=1 Tax=Maribacter sp. 2307UL18-2 TaxID=3386274 RepID=UPI0039BC3B96
MIYISEKRLEATSVDWIQNINVIEECLACLDKEDFSQPIKPYLRYGDFNNRIIAMPAFVGGNINMCGIKWISSFPDNLKHGIPRANCVVILNNPKTGQPIGIINTAKISSIRTASVSGFVIRKYLDSRGKKRDLKIGIVGFGPIGQHHLSMCSLLIGPQLTKIFLFDINGIDMESIPSRLRKRIEIVESWEQAYDDSDIFITCTVSKERYIDREPKSGSLHLNVSLRDYSASVFKWFEGAFVVDNWEEVCRENTDIEMFHLEKGLQRHEVKLIQKLDAQWIGSLADEQAIMFNPMGMAIFDIAISKYYLEKIKLENNSLVLD